MKWEKCGRKWLQHNLICCNPFCPDGLKKTQKDISQGGWSLSSDSNQ